MKFHFSAYTNDKKIVKGTVDAVSEIVAENMLLEKGYYRILQLEELRSGRRFEQLFSSLSKVKTQEIIEFTRELAYSVHSGITIISALQLLEEVVPNAKFRKIITEVIEQLQGGRALSEAISSYPNVFSELYCQVVYVGERSGNLERGLLHIVDHMEKQEEAKKLVKRALMYPTFLATLGFAVAMVLATVVLPQLTGMFSAMGAELPPLTRLVMASGDFLNNNKLLIMGGILIVIISVVVCKRRQSGKRIIDKLLVSMPWLSDFVVMNGLLHYFQTVAMLTKSGIKLRNSMSICSQIVRNTVIHEALVEVQEKVIQGKSLSKSMAETKLVPRTSLEMLVIGENTGELESALDRVANHFSRIMERKVSKLISAIEPTMTLAIGGVVGLIAVSLISPLYSIMGSF